MCLRQIALAGCVTKEPLQLCMCTVKRKKKIRYLVTSQHVTWNVLSTHIVKTCITKPNVATLLTLNPSHALKTFFFLSFSDCTETFPWAVPWRSDVLPWSMSPLVWPAYLYSTKATSLSWRWGLRLGDGLQNDLGDRDGQTQMWFLFCELQISPNIFYY